MAFGKLSFKCRRQSGFTLIEILVALAITAIIASGVTLAITHTFRVNASTSNRMVAVSQVQNAGYRISRDAEMAQSITTGDDPEDTGFPLTLIWSDWNGVAHKAIYVLDGDNGYIIREHYIRPLGETEFDLEATTVIARFIDPSPESTNCQYNTGTGRLILTVTATVGGFQAVTEQRVYEVIPEPSI